MEVIRTVVQDSGVAIDGKIAKRGQVNFISKDATFTRNDHPFNPYIKLEAMHSGNGVNVLVREGPGSAFITHNRVETPISEWRSSFGNIPGLPIEEEFGEPSALRAEYLGHPKRGILLELMSLQQEQFSPERNGSISGDKEGIIAVSGRVVYGNIYGLDNEMTSTDKPEAGFIGKLMLGVEMIPTYQNPDLRLFAATIADADGIVRVHNPSDIDVSGSGELSEAFLTRLAEFSLFAKSLTLPTESKSLRTRIFPHVVVNEQGLQNGFPLQLVGLIRSHIKNTFYDRTDTHFIDSMKKRYGFNWDKITASMPENALKIEMQRLQQGYAFLKEASTDIHKR